jgi:cell wall-associated NlpC family hydrolase
MGKPGRKTTMRLVIVATLVLPLVFGSFVVGSSAAPSKREVEAARTRLAELNRQMEAIVERYNTARERLRAVEVELSDARSARDRARAIADAATSRLGERAAAAFTSSGSQIGTLLDAGSFAEFSDRLEFMGVVAQNDAELANAAANAGAEATVAARRFEDAVKARQAQAEDMLAQLDDIKSMLGEQQQLYDRLDASYQDALAQQQAAADAAQGAAQGGDIPGDGTGGSGDTGGGGYVPPGDASAAQIAIDAAKSVIGAQYVFGTAGPDTFDCSGLTLWAYAKAGIYLPHSSQMQYDSFPKVSRDQLQPGDLIFFFSPIHHVAIYLGGNSMIDTVHPGADGAVAIRSVWWDLYVGAARPY